VKAGLGGDGRGGGAGGLWAIGQADRPAPPPPEAPPLALPTRPVSPRQVEFPHIQMLHRASGLSSGAQAASWRAEPLRRPPADPAAALLALRPVPAHQRAELSHARVKLPP